MVELREIIEENFYNCLNLDSGVSKEGHIDSVEFSLAEAWSNRPFSYPKAIYDGEELVGYASLYCEDQHGQIINFLIDKSHQGKGLGKAAAEACIDFMKGDQGVIRISLPVHKDHHKVRKFWKTLGFQESNNVEDNYVFMHRTT